MSEENKELSNEDSDFDVIIATEKKEDNTVVLTSSQIAEQWLSAALNKYDSTNKQYSAYLNDTTSYSTFVTPELLEQLSNSPQNNLSNILTINNIVRKYINKDDIIGKTVESIETNVNTDYKLSYKDYTKQRNKSNALDNAKLLIDDVNAQINVRRLIRNSIPTTYTEGTYICYLRCKDGNYVVDSYPLGVALISDYDYGGEPYVLIDIKELTARLKKTIQKNKKGKAYFFEKIEEEIKENYPPEVLKAYQDKDQFAKLDIRYSGVIRIGNLSRKYGLTPIFRALKPTLMLETFEESDRVNSKAKAKKIIFQKLRKEVLGQDYTKNGFEEMAYAHDNFMGAWKQPTVVVTAPAHVEDIKYVESQTELTDINTVSSYRSKVMSTLGIAFLADSKNQSVSSATISIDQLLKTINKISEQLEDILMKWYKNILIDNGLSFEYAPTVKVIDSEQMNLDVKKSLAEFIFCKLGGSYSTAFEILGLSVEDEKQKREAENKEKLTKVFSPHPTSYTTNGNSIDDNQDNVGRNKKDKPDNKQTYDEEYNKTRT